MELLINDIKERPDAYNYERAKRLDVSVSCVYWALKRLGVSYKKNVKSSESRRRKACIIQKENCSI